MFSLVGLLVFVFFFCCFLHDVHVVVALGLSGLCFVCLLVAYCFVGVVLVSVLFGARVLVCSAPGLLEIQGTVLPAVPV